MLRQHCVQILGPSIQVPAQDMENLDTFQIEGHSIVEIDDVKKMVFIYNSLQLAHKCIRNLFYG